MSGEGKKIAYLKEHLSYEFSMLNFTFRQLEGIEKRRLFWNALYESFFVHFRNVSTFLKDSEAHSGNWKVSKFLPTFQLSDSEKRKITGLVLRIESQIMHMGKLRGPNSNQINIADIRNAHAWCERNMTDFINQLSPIFQNAYKDGLFSENDTWVTIQLGPEGPSTSSNPSMHLSITASNNSQ